MTATVAGPRAGIAGTIASLLAGPIPVRLRAYDGSIAGDPDAEYELELRNERGLAYVLTAPGDLGLARAYVAGDLVAHGVHPGDPYPVLQMLLHRLDFKKPTPAELVQLVRVLGFSQLKPPPPPPEERVPAWRHRFEGLRTRNHWSRHSPERDASAISHHYDVSNTFYGHVLGPSMTYTCALFPTEDATLEEAQAAKYDLICRKLDLRPGQRLLDVGCGWGGMVRHAVKHYGVRALGVTLSREQARWGRERLAEEGLGDLAEIRHSDYRDVTERAFDAVSSIGLTEHIGVRNYPTYFRFLRDKLKPTGRLLNHCITRATNTTRPTAGAFIDRYVFPDGELTGSGTIVAACEDAGLEVQHHENIREHYARTLAAWNRNLTAHWDECVAEAGEGISRVWGLYMAGSRLAFERDEIQLHHVLATRNTPTGRSGYPLRHEF